MGTKKQSLDLNKLFNDRFPKWKDCINGHLGPEVESIEKEMESDGDRYYDVKVVRCGHCGIPLSSDYI